MPLLVARVATNHVNPTFSADNLTIFTNSFDAGADLHRRAYRCSKSNLVKPISICFSREIPQGPKIEQSRKKGDLRREAARLLVRPADCRYFRRLARPFCSVRVYFPADFRQSVTRQKSVLRGPKSTRYPLFPLVLRAPVAVEASASVTRTALLGFPISFSFRSFRGFSTNTNWPP